MFAGIEPGEVRRVEGSRQSDSRLQKIMILSLANVLSCDGDGESEMFKGELWMRSTVEHIARKCSLREMEISTRYFTDDRW